MRTTTENIPAWATGGSWQGRQYLSDLKLERLCDRGAKFLTLAAVMLMMYALFGKPFAYTFLGDMLLVAGLFLLLQSPGRQALLWQPIFAPLCVFMLWGAIRTLPFLPKYRLEAVRDAAIWGYGLWAFVFAGLLCASPHRLIWMLRKYATFCWAFLFIIPPLFCMFRLFGPWLPEMPGANVPIFHVKAGDAMVHLGGIVAFTILFSENRKLWLKIPMIAGIALVIGTNRGGLVSLIAAVFIAFIAKPSSKVIWTLLGTAVFVVVMLWATGIEIHVPGVKRGVSFEDMQKMVSSVTGGGTEADMEATKEWRLNWWKDIFNYTVRGPYFWAGKGFGINLAEDDGYQVLASGDLRSPHNGHMMILARTGVPGFLLWAVTQGMWFLTMVDSYYRSRASGDMRWRATFAFILAYWVGFMVNATFDVFLEGPMGGVWFWSVFGIGLAAMWIYNNCPEAMYPEGGQPQLVPPETRRNFRMSMN